MIVETILTSWSNKLIVILNGSKLKNVIIIDVHSGFSYIVSTFFLSSISVEFNEITPT